MQPAKTSVPLTELGLLLLLGGLWGIPYALTKVSLGTIPPITLTAARVLLAAGALWGFAVILRRRLPRWSWILAGHLFIQAGAACIIPYTLLAWGQQSVDSGLSAILNSTTPLFVCLFSVFWLHTEPMTFGRVFGAIVGLAGVVVIVGVSALLELDRQSLGQAAIILATCSSAISVIYGRRFADLEPEVVAAAMLTWAAVVLVPVALLTETPWHIAPSGASLAALALNGVVATAIGFAIYFRLIRTIGSMGTASASYLKPALGVLIGCTLMGEAFTWIVFVGLLAILFGVAAINAKATTWLVSNVIGYGPEQWRCRGRPLTLTRNGSHIP